MNTMLLGMSAAVGIGFTIYGTRKWLPNQPTAPQEEKPSEVTRLSDLSHLWTDNEVEIKDASNLWREQTKKNRAHTPRPTFRHDEIEQFFSE